MIFVDYYHYLVEYPFEDYSETYHQQQHDLQRQSLAVAFVHLFALYLRCR
jgi:hypothetical protein